MGNIIRAEDGSFCQSIAGNPLAAEESSIGGVVKLQQLENIGKLVAFKR
jgi:hypothetical protein